jgi:hypothetical protein
MDNRLNELRRKISGLRLKMLDMEASIRDQVNHDRDCTETALRLMGLRQELTVLVREWSLLGGGERLPTIQERLRENYRALQKRKGPTKEKNGEARLRKMTGRPSIPETPAVATRSRGVLDSPHARGRS